MQVQELAAGTLSGFLKGLPASAEAALRDACLADVQRLFPPGRAAKSVSPGAAQLGFRTWCMRGDLGVGGLAACLILSVSVPQPCTGPSFFNSNCPACAWPFTAALCLPSPSVTMQLASLPCQHSCVHPLQPAWAAVQLAFMGSQCQTGCQVLSSNSCTQPGCTPASALPPLTWPCSFAGTSAGLPAVGACEVYAAALPALHKEASLLIKPASHPVHVVQR